MSSSIITPRDAARMAHKRNETKKNVVLHARDRVLVQIQKAAGEGKYECYGYIPSFIMGMPIFKVVHVRDAVIQLMRNEGWNISIPPHVYRDDVVYIKWSGRV